MTDAIVKLLTSLKQYPFVISVNKCLVGAPQTHPYLVKNGYDCSSHLRQKMLLPQCITQDDLCTFHGAEETVPEES